MFLDHDLCSSLFYNVFVFSYLRHGGYHGGIDIYLFCYLSLTLAYLSNHCPSCEISWNICYCFSFSSQIFSWFSGFLFQHHHVRISGTFQTGCFSAGGWYESLLCSCYVFYRSKKTWNTSRNKNCKNWETNYQSNRSILLPFILLQFIQNNFPLAVSLMQLNSFWIIWGIFLVFYDLFGLTAAEIKSASIASIEKEREKHLQPQKTHK